jgi:DsbC/DsbD-like thiol-disulfide interchange protein
MRVPVVIGMAFFAGAVVAAQGDNPLFPQQRNAPKHISVSASADQTSARPGATVRLFVDVVPNPGIHVYAPGAKDYLPIALTISPQKTIQAAKTVYPKSELLAEPLSDGVPVYRKPFRLTREVTLSPAVESGKTLTLSGTVDYQACDDKVCYVPASAPITWTIAVK